MEHQQPAPVSGRVQIALLDREVAEDQADMVAEQLVVVARNKNDLGVVLSLAEERPNDVVVALGPVESVAETPAVDDVTDQIELFAFHAAEKIQQQLGLTTFESQMDIRYEDRPVAEGLHAAHSVHAAAPCRWTRRHDRLGPVTLG